MTSTDTDKECSAITHPVWCALTDQCITRPENPEHHGRPVVGDDRRGITSSSYLTTQHRGDLRPHRDDPDDLDRGQSRRCNSIKQDRGGGEQLFLIG